MFLAVMLMGTAMWGQTFYNMSSANYSQDFANISGWTANYGSGTGAANWRTATSVATSTVNNTTVFSTSTAGGVQIGTQNMVILATGSNSAATDLLLNFTGRVAGTISLDWAKVVNSANSSPRSSDLKIQYSIDNGVTFADITGYTIPRVLNNSTPESSSLTNIALPTDISNKSQVVIRFYVWTNGNTTGSGNRPKISIDNIAVTSTASNTPTITTSASTLTGFTYVAGSGPSAEQSFTVGGTSLTNDITITPTTNYQISTGTGASFASQPSITLTQASGTVANTTIYVRLKSGLTAGNYNSEVINITSTGATAKTVTASGSVTAPVISAALAGGPLGEVALTAGTATATVTLTNDTYAASLTTAGFTLNNAPTGLTLSSVDRTSATVATLHFTFTGDIDSNVTNLTVTVATNQLTTSTSALTTGSMTLTAVTETLTTTPTSITGLNYVSGAGPSTAQSFTVGSGNNLQAGGGTITLTAPSNFEVSTTSATTGFGTTADLTYTGTGTVSPNTGWVRLKSGLSIGSYSQSVTVAGGKASTTITVAGSVIAPPPGNDECTGATALTVNAANMQGTLENATQSIAGITCSGTGNADDDVWYSFTTSTAGTYRITADGGDNIDLVIDLRSGACTGTNIACADDTAGGEEVLEQTLSASTTYYVRVYDFDAITTLTTYTFDIKVQKLLSDPVATAATNVDLTSFTANWNAVSGASGYKLYVSTTSGTTTAAEWNFPNATDNATVDIANANNAGKTISTVGGTSSITYTSNASSTTSVAYASAWNNGNGTKYWQVEVNTTGLNGLTVSSAQRGSSTGPRDFKVQYKIGAGGTWTDVPGATITVGTDWLTGVLAETALPAACENQSSVFLRWIMTSNTSVGNGTTASGGTNSIDNVSIKGSSYLTGYNGLSVSGTSQAVTGLTQNTTYYYTVIAVSSGAPDSARSNEISQKTGVINTWNGDAWSAGTPPTIADNAVITGIYDTQTNGTFSANLLHVDTNKLTVAANTVLTVNGGITVDADAEMVVESNGNVVQIDETATNSGIVTVFRDSNPLIRFDYKIWSSPVSSQVMSAFSPDTDASRFYQYVTDSNNYQAIANSSTFAFGKGYLIRMPWDHPTAPAVWAGKYVGALNNGAHTVVLDLNNDNAANSYNAVGNPYASPINADDFIDANTGNIDGTLWFWRKKNGSTAETYVTYNKNMGGNSNTPGVPAPNGHIQVGQGFIVNATSTSLTFNNAMRESNFANQFFRNGNQANNTPERHRIWVNLTNAEGAFSQALVGYAAGATNGYDMGYDSKYLATNNASFFSVLGGQQYALQGRALPFSTTDVVPMGYKAVTAGSHTLALDHVDGLFLTAGQAIYIKDNVANTVHNLLDGAYTFTTGVGTFLNRFEIVYANEAMGVNDPVLTADNLMVYKDGNAVKINAGSFEMAEVSIFDMRGRLIAGRKNINATETTMTNITTQQQILIVQVKTAQNGTVSKKIVF